MDSTPKKSEDRQGSTPQAKVPRHGNSRNINPIVRGYLWVCFFHPQESLGKTYS